MPKPRPTETRERTRSDGSKYTTTIVRWTNPDRSVPSNSKLVDADDADDFRSWLRAQPGNVPKDHPAIVDGTWRGGASATTTSNGRQTLKEFAWNMIDGKSRSASLRTRNKEKRVLEMHFVEWLNKPMNSFTEPITDDMLDALEGDKTFVVGGKTTKAKTVTRSLASSTIIRYQWIIYGVFEQAVRDNVISENPFREEPPPVGTARRRLTDESINLAPEHYGAIILAAASIDRQTVELIRLLLSSGLRIGEALALQIQHLAALFDGGTTIKVRQALVRDDKGKTTVGTPKAAKKHVVSTSERNVEIPVDVAADLVAYFTELGVSKHDGNRFAFAAPKSIRGAKPWDYATWLRARWDRITGNKTRGIVALADLPSHVTPTPHCLRHTYACRMINGGVPMFEVSKQLGHASTRVTEERYARLCEDEAKRRARLVSASILPARVVPASTISNGWLTDANGRKVRRSRKDGKLRGVVTKRDSTTKTFAKSA